MLAAVIETNVIVVANMKSSHASPECITTCVDFLECSIKSMRVIVDSRMYIFHEYFKHANLSGQPGLGDEFVKLLWDNQGYTAHCEQVDITPKAGKAEDFEEFPNDPELSKFDPKDRKFVAVALASRHGPAIFNATDSDWMIFEPALKRHRVKVKCLCPGDIKKKRIRKRCCKKA